MHPLILFPSLLLTYVIPSGKQHTSKRLKGAGGGWSGGVERRVVSPPPLVTLALHDKDCQCYSTTVHSHTVPCICICHCAVSRLMKVARERLKHIFKHTAFFEGTESDPRKHEFVKTLLVREHHC